jgi:hypothetical protein
MRTVLVSVDDDKKRAVILVVVVIIIIIIIIKRITVEKKKENPFSFLLALFSFHLMVFYQKDGHRSIKNVDRLECLSSHFRARLARTYVHTV